MSVADEATYVRQAKALAEGRITVEKRDPQTGESIRIRPSSYPIGTSALQVPFVWLAGWRAAAVASVLALITTMLVLTRWLERERKSPLFALIVLGFPPALVMGRIAMSDVPSMALTSVGLFYFFRSNGALFRDWFLAGLIAGASLMLRETNPLIFVVLFAGAFFRRDKNWHALLIGGLAGLIFRPVTAFLITGDPFFVKPGIPPILATTNAAQNTALYLFALTVMVPGGLIAVFAYQGPRSHEVIATVLGFTAFYATYTYGALESGWQQRLILGPRFLLPLLPLLVLTMADAFPRIFGHFRSPRLHVLVNAMTAAWVIAVFTLIIATHLIIDHWGRSQEAIVEALFEGTQSEDALIIGEGLSKYANEVYGDRIIISWKNVPPTRVPRALEVFGTLQVATLHRTDSPYWLRRSEEANRYIHDIESQCELSLIHEIRLKSGNRLRVWNVIRCSR